MQRLLILAAGLVALGLLTWFCAYPKVAGDVASAVPEPAPAAPTEPSPPEPAKVAPVPPPRAVESPAARVVASIRRIVGDRVIEFEIGSATLAPSGSALLDELIASIRSEPTARLRIDGYTDSSGDPQFNLDLSRSRAEAVRAYLIGQGIDPARIEARGYGAERPIADNATAEGRLRNRRVEFTAIE
jgi:outer membrane protein OmpA-like peptidoglycan-associated protein